MTVALLVDNQPLIGESVRRMLATYADIAYHYAAIPRRRSTLPWT